VTTVHLTNAYHPSSGGIRTAYNALVVEGNRVGRRVVLIVPGPAAGTEDVGPFGRIYRIPAAPAPAFDRRYRVIRPHQYFPGPSGRMLVGILEREQPDLVEICDKYSLPYLAAMLRKRWHRRIRRPALVGLSAERFDDNMAAYLSSGPVARAFTRWYIRHIYGPPFDMHVANSSYTAGELREALWDRRDGFIRVCPPGVDATAFSPHRRSTPLREALLARAGGDRRSVLLLYAGRLSPEKNLDLLIAMMRVLATNRARDFRLVLAGDGPCAEPLRSTAAGLEGRVALIGALDRETLADCCASADVFVHPNPREPFGIGPLEAMASGVPVVVPSAGGVLEYATETNAWLAEPDAGAFAAATRAAAGGDPARTRCALTTAQAFSLQAAARRLFSLYDDLIVQVNPRRALARHPLVAVTRS
jgi:glycosyltransferase involved in cell wall biosynthesis